MELKSIQDIIHDNMMSYSSYVISQRALPDLRDGLKPSYRRILVTMHNSKAENFTKSQNVSGMTTKLHPHGDVYPTIVGMVQGDNNITPLITGKGSFGQHTSRDLQAAASRYTEVKLSDISKDTFKDIGKKMVEFIPNYDGKIMMPEVLPVKYPAVLHYAQSGIAVGMSCSLPSFNLKEINDATIKFIRTDEHTILIPDFATGGEIIENEEVFRQICETGSGTIRLRAKASIKGNVISIKEIPYTTTREAIIESIIKLIKSKKITEIADVQDLTGLEGMEIEITAKRNTDMNLLLAKLYKWTQMENTFSANMNMLVNKLPRVTGTHKVIEQWVKWRRECIRNGIRFELENLNENLYRLQGLAKILLDIDKAVEIIRFSKEKDINENLISHFEIDEIQADYVSNIKLKNLNKDVIIKRVEEIEELKNVIAEKEECLGNNGKINEIIISDIEYINSKYATERRTKVVNMESVQVEIPVEIQENEAEQVEEVDLNEEFKVIITKSGYIKKLKMDCMQNKMKDNDEIMHQFIATNKSEILVFVNTDAYKVYVSTLGISDENDYGTYLHSKLNVENIYGYALLDDSVKNVLIVYDNMKVAKIDARAYKTSSRRTKLENSVFSGAKPINVITMFDELELELHWKGTIKQYNTSLMKAKCSRNTQGVTIRQEKITIKEQS